MNRKLENALNLYLHGIRDGRAREAATACTGARYTQHSTGVADGVEGFVAFFEPFLNRNPVRDIRVVRAIVDGQYVFVHVAQSLGGGASRWITMDLFDTDSDDKSVEHWDVIAPWLDVTASGRSMVDGPAEPSGLHADEDNKALVRRFLVEVFQNGRYNRLAEFVAEDLAQHDPELADGRGALRSWLEGLRANGTRFVHDFVFKVVGQADIVVSYSKLLRGDCEFAVFDVWRVAAGRIVEHWSNAEAIGPRDAWGNSGKF
jgi:predicted SnoaL-like aldol condensation-catalyzing enzyme